MQILLRQIHFLPSLELINICAYIDAMQLYLVTNLLVCYYLVEKNVGSQKLRIVQNYLHFSESKRIEEAGGYSFNQTTVPSSFNFGGNFPQWKNWWETLSSAESFQKMMHHYGWAICLSYTMKMWKRVPLDIAGIRHNDFKSFVLQMERAFLRFCYQKLWSVAWHVWTDINDCFNYHPRR